MPAAHYAAADAARREGDEKRALLHIGKALIAARVLREDRARAASAFADEIAAHMGEP